MAHKVLVDGVAYNSADGKALVDGVAYNIADGRTLIGGVGYDIKFAPPVTWRKYSCKVSDVDRYTYTDNGIWEFVYSGSATSSLSGYSDYGFSVDEGFYGIPPYLDYSAQELWVGATVYYASGDYVGYTTITAYDSATGTFYYESYERTATMSYVGTETVYSRGSTNYGTVEANEGDVPDGGTLVKGSTSGSYCVVRVGGTYYYYVKV